MTDYDPRDEYRYMEQAGMSFRQILAALTTAPARRFGDDERATGRLEPGMSADLVLLDADPATDNWALTRVRRVWRRGRVIYSKDQPKGMKEPKYSCPPPGSRTQ
jgi:imidazolonepropionase-like amidohydrolase